MLYSADANASVGCVRFSLWTVSRVGTGYDQCYTGKMISMNYHIKKIVFLFSSLVLFILKRYNKLEEICSTKIQQEKKFNFYFHHVYANILQKNKKYSEAAKEYKDLINLGRLRAVSHLDLIRCLYLIEDYHGVLEAVDNYLSICLPAALTLQHRTAAIRVTVSQPRCVVLLAGLLPHVYGGVGSRPCELRGVVVRI